MKCSFKNELFLAVALLITLPIATFAAVPTKLSVQGSLSLSGGTLASGLYDITYHIYDSETGGMPLWSETHTSVQVTDGLFTLILGTVVPLTSDLLTSSSGLPGSEVVRYLECSIGGSPIAPRAPMVASPYAVASSRISGDVETTMGKLKVIDASSQLDINLEATHSESQISVTQNGVKRFGVGIEQPSNPLGTRMVVGDLDRDGLLDVAVSNDASKMTLTDSTDTGHATITTEVNGDLGLQPYGGGIKVHSQDSDGNGGIDLRCSPDSASSVVSGSSSTSYASVAAKVHKSGDTMTGDLVLNADPTSALRLLVGGGSTQLQLVDDRDFLGLREYNAVADPDKVQVGLSCDSDGDGISSKNIGLYVSEAQGQAEIDCSADSDDDGTPDQKIVTMVTASAAQHAIDSRGTGAQGGLTAITSSTTLDSAITECSSDADGDGNPELVAKKRMINADAKLEAVMSVDSDDDGHSEFKRLILVSGSEGSSSRMASDVDDDGDDDNSIEESCDAVSAKIVMDRDSGRSKGFMKVSPEGPSISLEHEYAEVFNVSTVLDSTFLELNSAANSSKLKGQVGDLKGDITLSTSSGGKLQAQLNDQKGQLGMSSSSGSESMDLAVDNSTGPGAQPSSSFRLGRPAVNEGLFLSDATSMSLTLLHDEGGAGSSSAEMFSDLIDSYINLTDDGVTSYRASSSSGLEMRSSSDVATCTIDRDGNAYLANTLGVGVSGGGHHIDVAGGAYCDGTDWVNASDRNTKENFERVDGEELLRQLSHLELAKWNYKGDEKNFHIGPTAQDFKRAFGVGSDGKSISTIDPAGIALAAIQELYLRLREKNQQLASQSRQLEELQAKINKIQQALEKK